MRYLLVIMLMLLPTLSLAQDQFLPRAIDEPNEWAIWMFVMTTSGWAFRTWWKDRIENKHKHDIEQKLEKEWTNGDATLPGSRNPGRTLPQLVEIVHQDLQQHKHETNRRFDKVHSDLGEIKGELKNINRGGN